MAACRPSRMTRRRETNPRTSPERNTKPSAAVTGPVLPPVSAYSHDAPPTWSTIMAKTQKPRSRSRRGSRPIGVATKRIDARNVSRAESALEGDQRWCGIDVTTTIPRPLDGAHGLLSPEYKGNAKKIPRNGRQRLRTCSGPTKTARGSGRRSVGGALECFDHVDAFPGEIQVRTTHLSAARKQTVEATAALPRESPEVEPLRDHRRPKVELVTDDRR